MGDCRHYEVVAALLGVILGTLLGYALNFEPDFSVSLFAQKVNLIEGMGENNMIISDKCLFFIPFKQYNDQIYFTYDELPDGLSVEFEPTAINSLKSSTNSKVDIFFNANRSIIKPDVYPIYIKVNGADTKQKICRIDVNICT